ncbi:hypothetical protein ABZ445_16010 [Streptomyces chartreusis]|uniref:hypothetical protein n=1 Tax=Streptomyces chartreusis TaxID=1969 RepID=UPI0033D6BA5C
MATLTTHVHVTDDKGASHVFGPADEVPKWAQERITNPKAWAEAPSVERLTEPAPAAKAPVKRAAPRRRAAGSGTVRSE